MDEAFSPETCSEALPILTSRPADLVTLARLQLTSMGAQHPGAAEAAHLLRCVDSLKELTEPGSNLSLEALSETPLPRQLKTPPTPAAVVEFEAISDSENVPQLGNSQSTGQSVRGTFASKTTFLEPRDGLLQSRRPMFAG